MAQDKNPQLEFYASLIESGNAEIINPPKEMWGTPDVVTCHKIIVTHVRPPIPNADHVVAYSDDLGADTSPIGTGPDAASAIEDLTWQLAELEEV